MHKEAITQNAQYTFKYNSSLGRHGWLRLTPAYSVRLVEEILAELDYTPRCVMEPFSGTGTTELVCANKGISSFALEINPFLVWLGNAKLGFYQRDKVVYCKHINAAHRRIRAYRFSSDLQYLSLVESASSRIFSKTKICN